MKSYIIKKSSRSGMLDCFYDALLILPRVENVNFDSRNTCNAVTNPPPSFQTPKSVCSVPDKARLYHIVELI